MKFVTVLALAAVSAAAVVLPARADEAKTEAKSEVKTEAKAPAVKAAMTLVEARSKIAGVIAKPETIKAILKNLSPEEQLAFIREVNLAAAAMPGKKEEIGATFVSLAHETMTACVEMGGKGASVAQYVAAIFSSVPVEYLPAISETLGSEFFNRGSGQSSTMSAAAYLKQARAVMAVVQPETKKVDANPVRDTLALEMFIVGYGEDYDTLMRGLVGECFTPEMRPMVTGWLSEVNNSSTKSYDGMMAYAGVEVEAVPDVVMVLRVSGEQRRTAFLADTSSGVRGKNAFINVLDNNLYAPVSVNDLQPISTTTSRPVTTDPTKPWNPNYKRDQIDRVKEKTVIEPEEPEPYPVQEP